ncbi:ABC transporter substrate-binding protein [Myxosarcina sp. GI1(2024)]
MLNKYAEALGKTDKAEQILADYHARIEEFQTQMGDRLQKTEVSIVRVLQNGLYIYQDSFSGAIVADAGLPRPLHQTKPKNPFGMAIGKESLHIADGDVIFVRTFDDDPEMAKEAQSALKQLKADPLWLKLNAVRQDEVYEVPGYWGNMGPIAANLVLDDLFEYLVEKDGNKTNLSGRSETLSSIAALQ